MKKAYITASVVIAGLLVLMLVHGVREHYAQSPTEEGLSVDAPAEIDPYDGLAVFPQGGVMTPTTFPLDVEGMARGMWFFEADFPMEVRTPDGRVVAEGLGTATGEWMTIEPVPFYGVLLLTENAPDYSGQAELVLRNANPSGLPEHQLQFIVPLQIEI